MDVGVWLLNFQNRARRTGTHGHTPHVMHTPHTATRETSQLLNFQNAERDTRAHTCYTLDGCFRT